MKLVTTAMFSTLLLGASFSTARWISFLVLAFGVILAQVSGLAAPASNQSEAVEIHMTIPGLVRLAASPLRLLASSSHLAPLVGAVSPTTTTQT